MNSENSETSDPHRLLLNFTDKTDKRRQINILLYQILAFFIHGKILKNHIFKTWSPTWHEEFELPDGSYCISDVQDYFEYIFKKHGKKTVNPSIKIYIYKIEHRITFKINTGYYLKLSTREPMKLLVSTKNKIAKDENGENVSYWEVTEAY